MMSEGGRPRVSIEDRPDLDSCVETALRAFAGSLREEKGQGTRAHVCVI